MSEATGTSSIRLSQELTIFHDVAKALTSSLNLDSILQTIMEKMAEYFRPDTWSLLMVDEEKDELYFAIAVGAAAEVLSKARLKVGEGIAGWVARHGQVLIVPDVQSDPRFSSRLDEITRVQTHSVICVPLRSKHRVLGVIQMVNASVEMSEQEMFFLQALCDYAAISIENARSVEKIQELTITDDCTGLFNARHLHKTLETEVYRSARFGYQFSVIFIDLDHFKTGPNASSGDSLAFGSWSAMIFPCTCSSCCRPDAALHREASSHCDSSHSSTKSRPLSAMGCTRTNWLPSN